jgi:hypothetical protein
MLHNIPEWARPAAKVGIICAVAGLFCFLLASFLAFVVPGVGNWIGDGPLFVLLGAGGFLFIAAQVCAIVIHEQGEARGKWR